MKDVTIHLYESVEEEGYLYDIYEGEPNETTDESLIDGGHCTGSYGDALAMAGATVLTLKEQGKLN